MTDKAKTNKNKYLKYLFFIIIIIIIIVAANISGVFKSKHKPSKTITETPVARPKPVFRKDGELTFKSSDNDKLIMKIDIEIADEYEERMQGLMYRNSMDEKQGMLFIFETEEPQSFWMKNTYIPLDIIYVNSTRKIVKIQNDTKILSEESIPSVKPALYVVEVNAGFCKKYNIKENDIIEFR